MFSSKVKSFNGYLTKTEDLIAEYILHHSGDVRFMTSSMIAKELEIGQSNIIRFAQKLGYKGFRELQLDIDVEQEERQQEIQPDESIELTNAKIVDQYIEIVQLTNSMNSPETIGEVVKLMSEASRIVCFGVGNSHLFAEYLSNQLLKMGLNSICSFNSHIIYSTISNSCRSDLIIIISETGETREVIKLAKIAKNKNIPVVAITRMSKNKLSALVDISLNTFNANAQTRLNAMTKRCSQLCLIDMLCLNLAKNNFKKYKKTIVESENLLDDHYFGQNNTD